MARPRGRPKIRGQWTYYLHLGNRQDRTTVIKETPTEVKRALQKFFRSQDEHARRYCNQDEYAALVALIMTIDEIDDRSFEHTDQLDYRWTFQWGGAGKMTVAATVIRVPVGAIDVEVKNELL